MLMAIAFVAGGMYQRRRAAKRAGYAPLAVRSLRYLLSRTLLTCLRTQQEVSDAPVAHTALVDVAAN